MPRRIAPLTPVKAPSEAQITGAERVLIRALASATADAVRGDAHFGREGADEEFDPARQAQFALQSEHCMRAWPRSR